MGKKTLATFFRNGIGNFILLMPTLQSLSEFYDISLVLDDGDTSSSTTVVKEIAEKWDKIKNVYSFYRDLEKVFSHDKIFVFPHVTPVLIYKKFVDEGLVRDIGIPWRECRLHEVDLYWLAAKEFCPEIKAPSPVKDFPFAEGPILDSDKLKIVLCNGAFSGSRFNWERKRWDKLSTLVGLLSSMYDCEIYFLGGKAEKEQGEKLAEEFPVVHNYAAKTTITETAKILDQCDLFIANDTGIMHLGDLLQKRMVVLFGPTVISKSGPYFTEDYRIVRSPCACAPCQFHWVFSTCQDNKCMRAIKVEKVVEAVQSLLEGEENGTTELLSSNVGTG